MSVDERSFRKTLGCFATGVTVVTALREKDRPVGVTVSAFSSLSLEPPLVLICLGRRTADLGAYVEGPFVVNVLKEDQRDLSIRFASRRDDKWDGVAWEGWETGVPVLKNCLANIECTVETTHDGGDHVIIVGRVRQLRHAEGGSPLIYFRGAYLDYGPPPPVAGA